jgi:phosphoglycerate dehydrogenase-like enzyme
MLRVGYPATLLPELLRELPPEVELIPISDELDHEVEIDVWIPDPYSNRAIRSWPHLRGVKLVLSMMAGTEWIPGVVGPQVTICNAHEAHNTATAEWVVAAILSMLKYIPLYLDIQRTGIWKRRFEAAKLYADINADPRPLYPPVLLEELTGKTVLIVGYGAIGKEIERMLAPFRVSLLRIARTARVEPHVHAVLELDALIPQADIIVLILPYTAESHGLIGSQQLALMR